DRTGEEFVYPRSQAMMIAKATHREVLSTESYRTSGSESERMSAMKGSTVTRVGESTTASTEPAPANTVNGRDVSKSAPSATAAQSSTTAKGTTGRSTGRKRLPRTASSLGLFELLSALA